MDTWTFDVATALHHDVKNGVLARRWSRVTLSATEFPDWRIAAQIAGNMAVAIHGGMPTSITPVI